MRLFFHLSRLILLFLFGQSSLHWKSRSVSRHIIFVPYVLVRHINWVVDEVLDLRQRLLPFLHEFILQDTLLSWGEQIFNLHHVRLIQFDPPKICVFLLQLGLHVLKD